MCNSSGNIHLKFDLLKGTSHLLSSLNYRKVGVLAKEFISKWKYLLSGFSG